jgi:hypothetical protein
MQADGGTMRIPDPATGSLRIAVRAGFSAEFLQYFARVDDDTSAFGASGEPARPDGHRRREYRSRLRSAPGHRGRFKVPGGPVDSAGGHGRPDHPCSELGRSKQIIATLARGIKPRHRLIQIRADPPHQPGRRHEFSQRLPRTRQWWQPPSGKCGPRWNELGPVTFASVRFRYLLVALAAGLMVLGVTAAVAALDQRPAPAGTGRPSPQLSGLAGLAERVLGAAQALWPLAVVASRRHAVRKVTMPSLNSRLPARHPRLGADRALSLPPGRPRSAGSAVPVALRAAPYAHATARPCRFETTASTRGRATPPVTEGRPTNGVNQRKDPPIWRGR